MKRFISLFAIVAVFWSSLFVQTGQAATVCSQQAGAANKIYLPAVLSMAQIDALEQLENILRKPAEFPFDGWITEVFPETVTMRLVGSNQVKRNVQIPSHISADGIELGVPARLGMYRGQPILLAILPNLSGDLNYAGKGSVIPNPPYISVVALADGWHVTWGAVSGATSYVVYRNDTADETSPDEVGETTKKSMVVPYESPYIYFAVRSVSGLNESELSGWLTDDTAPATPKTFYALGAIQGHELVIDGDDASLSHQGFKCWEIEQADDDSGTNAVSLGEFYLADFPSLQAFGRGTVKYYRIRAVDYGGNASDWTDWDYAYAGQDNVQDKFDGYGGNTTSDLESLWWLELGKFTSGEGWSDVAGSEVTENTNTSYLKEGGTSYGVKRTASPTLPAYVERSVVWDLSQEGRFTDDDYIVLAVYIIDLGPGLNILSHFMDSALNSAFFDIDVSSTGWNYIKVKKSDFTIDTGLDWSDITYVDVGVDADGTESLPNEYVYFDSWRIVKADPDDADTYNDTGAAWDRAANTGDDVGEWHIYEGNRTGEPAKPYSYGQIKTADSPSLWYLSHKPISTTNIFSGTIQSGMYLKGINARGGLAFFVTDVTADSWDMYVVEANSGGDTITLAKYVDGTRTQIASAGFTFAPNQILWLGADFKDYQADGGRIKVYASLSEGNLIQAANLVISAQDTEWISDPGGSVGVTSYQSNVRFVSFVAGSPEHAETADVARALDGPIVAGETKRVRYNPDYDRFEYTTDGQNYTQVQSKLVAPDGSPDPAISVNSSGYLSFPTGAAINQFATSVQNNNTTVPTGAGVYDLIRSREIEAIVTGVVDLTAGTWQTIAGVWTEYVDVDGLFDPSTGEITISQTGRYHIEARVTVTTGSVGSYCSLMLQQYNGSTWVDVDVDQGHFALANYWKTLKVSTVKYFSSGHKIRLRLFHSESQSDCVVRTGGAYSNIHFECVNIA